MIFKPLSLLSLPALNLIGASLGRVLFYCMQKSKRRAIENISQSQLFADNKQAVRQSYIALGKAILETPYIWDSDNKKITELMRDVQGWNIVETAIKANKGIIFLTPHMGCFEITSLYYALHYPISVLYRPPKKKWMLPLVHSGRTRQNITLAEANASGVRNLMRALKKGEAIGILPDQAPASGEGEWADFFGKPAYTMTASRKFLR